ncbi:MAG: ABC transporter ATP-binding protein [Ardenticatenaceae bacterium]|nr:ABC transporter ATP-binding protein [Anaerolineales bacterium]MCB8973783.1 ABC transporter ATP-binding protein [Ardenticatenaceae bacterium]
MNDVMITANGLARSYGRGNRKVEAVQELNLQVPRGEIFGLVGPDGAGKTTTIQMLCGILTPSAGTATVAGVNVVSSSAQLGGKIGYMSEGFTLYGNLSVEENLDFFADLYKVPADVAAKRKQRLLHFARLEPARHRRAEHLSGGMKKKLALACTLIYQPQVLFLDEPTTGVDPVSRQEFWKILYEFLAEGITIFVTTPYMDEAERCHQVALMRQGRLIACDTPAVLKQQLQGTAVDLIAHPQTLAMTTLRKAAAVSQVQAFGERLHLLLGDGRNPEETFLPELANAGIQVTEWQTAVPTLEDVFIAAIEAQRADNDAPKRPLTQLSENDQKPHIQSDGEVAVYAENLTKRFGEFTAVDQLSFQVRRGEIFGFLGPNGSGKTTTIRMLCGLVPPTSGNGRVAGFDVERQRVKIRPHIGYMSQKFSLYNDLTVRENIQFFGSIYDIPPARLAQRRQWVLNMAGLTGKEHLLARDLSGGWKQRLALGCAILHEPDIIFLDEPTSGVDPVSRREFWDLIFALSVQGVTVFVTTHYMDEAEHCHNLGLLYGGRLIACGSPEQLRANVKQGAIVEVPVRDSLAALKHLDGQPEILQTGIFGNQLHVLVQEPDSGKEAIKQALAPPDLMTGPAQVIPITLEDLFMLLIEEEEQRRARR